MAMRTPKNLSKSEHALQQGVRAGAEVAFRIRNDKGSWVGEKGIKVASAAITSATLDLLLGTDQRKHPLAHLVVSKVEGVIIDRITHLK
jgi:hypothetical protein